MTSLAAMGSNLPIGTLLAAAAMFSLLKIPALIHWFRGCWTGRCGRCRGCRPLLHRRSPTGRHE